MILVPFGDIILITYYYQGSKGIRQFRLKQWLKSLNTSSLEETNQNQAKVAKAFEPTNMKRGYKTQGTSVNYPSLVIS